MSVIDRLKAKQETDGLSMDGLAKVLGVTRQSVHNWYNAGRTPTGDNLMKILRYLGDL